MNFFKRDRTLSSANCVNKKSHYIQVLVCTTGQFPVGRVEIKKQSFFVSPVIFLRFIWNDIKVNSFKPLGV